MNTRPRVVVAGSINVDLSIRVQRLPLVGETVTALSRTRYPGGKGANQATAAARLGCDSLLIASVGDDEAGTAVVRELLARSVEVSFVQVVHTSTGEAIVVVDDEGENQIVVLPGANADLSPDHVASSLARVLGPDDVVLVNLEIPDDCVFEAALAARAAGARFILNPAPARPLTAGLVPLCDVLTPNDREVLALGFPSIDALLDNVSGGVVVTKGGDGAVLYRPGELPLLQPAFPADVLDTTGAGDTFSAAFACSLARRESLSEALRYAAAAAALSTRAGGPIAGLPTDAEVRQLMGEHRAPQRHPLETRV